VAAAAEELGRLLGGDPEPGIARECAAERAGAIRDHVTGGTDLGTWFRPGQADMHVHTIPL
jgi:hypothetical protein